MNQSPIKEFRKRSNGIDRLYKVLIDEPFFYKVDVLAGRLVDMFE